MIIAVDGPAASGKGTLARRVADALGFAYLDTGLLYRATGRLVLDGDGDPSDAKTATAAAEALRPEALGRADLRGETSGAAASKVAAIPGVRAALLAFQRDLAANPPFGATGAVLDGRDIGTVVCPDAQVKLFLTASLAVRAERRYKELAAKDSAVIYERVFRDLEARDARDSGRDIAPLTAAPDALTIDTDRLNADQVFDKVMAYIETKRTNGA